MLQDDEDQVVAMLQDRGHDAAEIEKILKRLRELDNETLHDSVMDSISRGTFDLSVIIEEALREEPGQGS